MEDAALSAAALAFAVFAIAYPLSAARYPPMIDLPFHAAQASAWLHYDDPAFHIREQFELRLFAVPYLSMYALAGALMTALPVVVAIKIAAGAMLALLPAGLAVMFRGMKKSPLLGLAGLLAVWCPLTHWGFLNFMGALGLFALVVGLALLVIEAPTRGRRLALAAALCALFFTHLFRFPLALAAVCGAGLVAGGARRGLRTIGPSLVPAVALFAAWLAVRPASLRGSPSLSLSLDRLSELWGWLWGSFDDPAEPRALVTGVAVLAGVAAVAAVAGAIERRASGRAAPPRGFQARAALIGAGCAAASLLLFLTLPMQINDWWYVYPREATAACFLALALLPDLPRARGLRAALVTATAAASLPMVMVVARNYAAFEPATRDFEAITRDLPQAPKLLYLIFDHSGSTRTVSPFTHLPAYVQAERGGSLSHHFAIYGASPLLYRPREGRETIVPPPTPPRWEATPQAFDVQERGRFFDWFLVRRKERPDELFEADPTIVLSRNAGLWWLYRRRLAGEEPRAGLPRDGE